MLGAASESVGLLGASVEAETFRKLSIIQKRSPKANESVDVTFSLAAAKTMVSPRGQPGGRTSSTNKVTLVGLVVVAGLLAWRSRPPETASRASPLPRATSWAPQPPPTDVVALGEKVTEITETVAALQTRLDAHVAGLPAPAPKPKPPLSKPKPPAARNGTDLEAHGRALLAAVGARAFPATDARLPYFLHLHKAGGTTVCHVARMSNKLRAAKRNCNMAGDGPRTLLDGVAGYANGQLDGDCAGRKRWAAKTAVDFVAVERWLDAGTALRCRRDFFFVTVLRDPIKRIVSHCRFERIPSARALGWLSAPSFDRDMLVREGTAVVDNFYVRSLLGADVYAGVGPGGVTARHAAAAMDALAAFDAVLILETLDASFQQLFRRLGWCEPPRDEMRQSFGKGDESIVFDADQTRRLVAANGPDAAVYAFAVELARTLEARLPPAPPATCGRPAAVRRLGGNGNPLP